MLRTYFWCKFFLIISFQKAKNSLVVITTAGILQQKSQPFQINPYEFFEMLLVLSVFNTSSLCNETVPENESGTKFPHCRSEKCFRGKKAFLY
jgi:hypothetical protein